MKLTKINYVSAVYIGVATLVMYVIMISLQLIIASQDPLLAPLLAQANKVELLVYTPIIGGVVAYVLALVMIFVYNIVAKKFPIGWTVSK